MRVALVSPPPIAGTRYTREGRCQEKEAVLGAVKPPLTLLYLASILRKAGHEVLFLDANAKRMGAAEMQARLARFGPAVVMFATSTPTIADDMAAMKDSPGIVFAFGPHVKVLHADVLREYGFLRGVVTGEPEAVAGPLCDALAKGRGLGRVRGIAYRAGRDGDGRLRLTKPSVVSDINSLPAPALDLLDFGDYRLPNNGEPFSVVEISRGCQFSCAFCIVPVLRPGFRVAEKSPKAIVDEMERTKNSYGVRYFYLLRDSTMKSGDRQISGIAGELIRRKLGVRWMTNTRIDAVCAKALKKMKQSGCWLLAAGIEAEDDDALSAVRKGFRHGIVAGNVAKIRKSGISLLLFFIFGFADDTPERMRRRAEYAAGLDADFANFYPLVPYPGTRVFSQFVRSAGRNPEWEKCDYSHYALSAQTGLAEAAVLSAVSDAYLKFYAKPGRLARLMMKLREGDWRLIPLLSSGVRFAWRVLARAP